MESFEKLLDKEYEKKTAKELVKAPVAALAGLTEADGKLLKQVLGVETIGDLATNKFVAAARQIQDTADRSK